MLSYTNPRWAASEAEEKEKTSKRRYVIEERKKGKGEKKPLSEQWPYRCDALQEGGGATARDPVGTRRKKKAGGESGAEDLREREENSLSYSSKAKKKERTKSH